MTGAEGAISAEIAALEDQIRAATARGDRTESLRLLRLLIVQTADHREHRVLWAHAQQTLGERLVDDGRPHDLADVELAIEAYRSALTVLTAEEHRDDYGSIQNNIGAAHFLLQQARPERSEQHASLALAAHEAALAVRPRQTDPYGWARTQNNIGNVLALRSGADRIQYQARAIDAFHRALQVHNPMRYPTDYAMDLTNLGLTYDEWAGGIRSTNLDQAIVCFLRALLVVDPSRQQRKYRQLILSLADAIHERIDGAPADHRQEVVGRLRPALDAIIQAEVRFGIPATREPAEPQRQVAEATDLLPDPDLFQPFWHDQYLLTPLFELLQRIEWARSESSPDLVGLLRAAVDRQDLVLPTLRAEMLGQLAVALLGGGSAAGAAGGRRTGRDLEDAIDALKQAREIYDPHEDPAEWINATHLLAAACAERVGGDRAENLDQAIDLNRTGLRVARPRTQEWALLNQQRGQLYRDRRFGDPRANARVAQQAFESALMVWSRRRHPYEWARVKNSLALTWLNRADDDPGLADAAIPLLTEALKVLTPKKHPYEWAGVQRNLSMAYSRRISGDPADNCDRAIAALEAILAIHTREQFPSDWAQNQHNLGQLYRKRLRGGRGDNLRRAQECLRAALEVHTAADRPAEHRVTSGALGMVAVDLQDWDAAHQAFSSAAAAEDWLLSAVSTGIEGFDDVTHRGHGVAELDAYAQARLGRLAEGVEAVERGRARWLAGAGVLASALPERITDPDRRRRFTAARAHFLTAQAAVNQGVSTGRDVPSIASAADMREAQEAFNAVVTEIRAAADPADFHDLTLSAGRIAAGAVDPIVYLVPSPWGGIALAVHPAGAITAHPLPELSDAVVNDLVERRLEDGVGATVGGFAVAQEGLALNWLVNEWPGDSFSDKAQALHAACQDARVEGSLDAAAQAVLTAGAPGLQQLTGMPVLQMDEASLARLGASLNHVMLQIELARCLKRLANAAMAPLADWLLAQGLTAATLVPCGMLPAFPLLAAPASDGTTFADRLSVTVAPSARSVIEDARTPAGRRAGVCTLGDPLPTHQRLRWAEAEALTVAAVAGHPEQARTGEAATRGWLIEGLTNARVVDASCHGTFDGIDVLNSRLLLAERQSLSLRDALSHDVDLTGLRLLLLSACQAAVMDLRGALAEVRSLATGFLQAGAQAVMAPLWAVDDRATYLLMVRFAQEWLPRMDTESPARALARAQAWLRTVTQEELAAWNPHPAPNAAQAATSSAAPSSSGRDMAAVRGRGNRYTAVQAEALTVGLASRAAPGHTPYADPVFWAAFHVVGH